MGKCLGVVIWYEGFQQIRALERETFGENDWCRGFVKVENASVQMFAKSTTFLNLLKPRTLQKPKSIQVFILRYSCCCQKIFHRPYLENQLLFNLDVNSRGFSVRLRTFLKPVAKKPKWKLLQDTYPVLLFRLEKHEFTLRPSHCGVAELLFISGSFYLATIAEFYFFSCKNNINNFNKSPKILHVDHKIDIRISLRSSGNLL